MAMVSGLVISTARDCDIAAVQRALVAREGVTVGKAEAQWIPVVIEAEDDVGIRELHDWIGTIEGVEYVDVAHVNFDEDQGASPDDHQNSTR